ncbi:MAG TPA: PQQ-dependent dehydrogenase, methanol/ethanol family [Candidatus Acidoferrum sp.]|nr:PQQ-dependent dehydrogenase, methanol/ethanol family [Candidatus Acidoferrum sp.]
MHTSARKLLALTVVAAALAACSKQEAPAPQAAAPAPVASPTAAQLTNAQNDDGKEWLSYGRDYAETRFSPLKQITADNVKDLGVAWTFDTDSFRGLEGTPLVHDGIIYATRPWSSVFALDARTGKKLWDFDPQVDKSMGWKACCDVVNRGVALYENKIYVGALDGRLIALDAKTGAQLWQVQTTDPKESYTITGAPRVVDGKVLIGQGGAEMATRGYLTAYDANTGEQKWRFWVVPGDPAKGFENPDVEKAATTWSGKWWETGGGGNPWDTIVYDAEARLLYVGTGNGSPWSHQIRSEGKGDNLYLSSIVALNIDDGRVKWYYQPTPAENWDYDATQPLMLNEFTINGQPRKVVMQASKNGFFYVLDRMTGKLLTADPFAEITWASGIDLETGRPKETPEGRYTATAISMVMPGPTGAHNWHPMSYNPATGLIYLPTIQGSSFPYSQEKGFVHKPGTWNLGINTGTMADIPQRPKKDYAPGTGPKTRTPGALLAWDPIKREPRWVVDYPYAIDGGTLSTAGNLVFQGGADGKLRAFTADKGELSWEVNLGVGIMAPPVTYELDGKQYLSVLAGWGGSSGLIGPSNTGEYKPIGRLWTFVLGGDKNIVPVKGMPLPELTAIAFDNNKKVLAHGEDIYGKHCMLCHGAGGVSGGTLADLRYAAPATYDNILNIVRHGAYAPSMGMPNLGEWVTDDDVLAVKNWLLSLRADLMKPKQPPAKK